MAGGPGSRAAAGSLFPRRLHRAGRDRGHRVPEQGRRLRSAVQGGGRDADDHRRRSQASRRPHRPHRRAAHLGLGADPSSPCPHHRSRRRPVAGRIALDRLQAGLLPAGARALAPVPPAVPRRSRRAQRRRPPGLLRRSVSPRRRQGVRRRARAPASLRMGRLRQAALRRAEGGARLSVALHPSRRHLELPARRARRRRASPSNGKTIGSRKATGSRP